MTVFRSLHIFECSDVWTVQSERSRMQVMSLDRRIGEITDRTFIGNT